MAGPRGASPPRSSDGRGTPAFPASAIAALFIERQHLDRPRARALTAENLERFAEDAGGIQLDSINVLERAHYLTAWSRFGPYDRADFDRLVYGERVLFEYWAHAACLVSTSQLDWWRRAMLDYRVGHTGWRAFLKKNPKLLGAVEETIRERGPLGNAHFQHARPGASSAGWWSWKPATHALHHLWMTGRVLVHSRVHFQKRFDLAERVMPRWETLAPPPAADFHRWHLARSLHAMGAATDLDLRMYLTFPRLERGLREKTLAAMLESGEVTEIAVEGDRSRWLALARDLPALERAAGVRTPARGTTLLSPFDSLLWHRERARRLFGFDYRIEVYTPGHRRVHGYYVLPIFHDGRLIGRLDAKNHRDDRRLEVRRLGFEAGFPDGAIPPASGWERLDPDRAIAAVAEALDSLAAFLGAERIGVGRVVPARFTGALRQALREVRAEPERIPGARTKMPAG